MRIRVDGARLEVTRLQNMTVALEDRLRVSMAESMADVQDYARQHHRFTTRTGDTEKSIMYEVHNTATGAVGKVYTDSMIAIYQHEGTRAHTIVPRRKRVLRWVDNGAFVFARRANVNGIRADPFVYNAADALEGQIVSRLDAILKGL